LFRCAAGGRATATDQKKTADAVGSADATHPPAAGCYGHRTLEGGGQAEEVAAAGLRPPTDEASDKWL
jgi:hypothetical protein